jgi:hypothetical protein
MARILAAAGTLVYVADQRPDAASQASLLHTQNFK